MADARRGQLSVVLVAEFDRIARSTKNFLEIVDDLNELEIEFISAREAIDTSGPMGRMFITLVGSIAELERSLIRRVTGNSEVTRFRFLKRGPADNCREQGLSLPISERDAQR
jgi:DNA invertase Pin-like site-specific DNA recombinase